MLALSRTCLAWQHILPFALTLALTACTSAAPKNQQRPTRPDGTAYGDQAITPISTPVTTPAPRVTNGVMLGIDVLEQQDFRPVIGKRIGLLTHPAGVNRFGLSTIDVIRRDKRLRLVALYGPEHGIYGNEKADAYVPDRIDTRTGLHVYSLYGPTRKPTSAMLQGIDVMIIDLQDLGVRSYTYVSCMKLTIEACFENNIEVIVLDRPNPLGGHTVSGPMHERKWMSYVGAYLVPYVHALTIGELARMAVSEPGFLEVPDEVRQRGRITIIPMRGWNRNMRWPQTGLKWVATSPYIPTFEAVVGYPMTGLGAQLGGFKHGIGTEHPFRLLSHPQIPRNKLIEELTRRNIPGLRFVPASGTTASGTRIDGVYVEVADWNAWRPTELSFHMMQIAASVSQGNPFAEASKNSGDLFNKHVGSSPWWQAITTHGANVNIDAFFTTWQTQAEAFHERSRRHWFYQ